MKTVCLWKGKKSEINQTLLEMSMRYPKTKRQTNADIRNSASERGLIKNTIKRENSAGAKRSSVGHQLKKNFIYSVQMNALYTLITENDEKTMSNAMGHMAWVWNTGTTKKCKTMPMVNATPKWPQIVNTIIAKKPSLLRGTGWHKFMLLWK